MFGGGRQRRIARHTARPTKWGATRQPQRFTDGGRNLDCQRYLALRLRVGECLPQAFRQARIVCLPDFLPYLYLPKIDVAAAESQLDLPSIDRAADAAIPLIHLVDATSLLLTFAAIAFEDDTVARLDASLESNRDALSRNSYDSAQQHASFGRTEARHERLVVATSEPSG
jgi:hypothetical protein